jgi:hypothetical protein
MKTTQIKSIFSILITGFLLSACNTLHSTTTIQAKDAFILGNNQHGRFAASVTNTSAFPVSIWQYPIDGGRHSPIILQPTENAKIRVDKNTALRIENTSEKSVDVKLVVKGDVGLSMGYQK